MGQDCYELGEWSTFSCLANHFNYIGINEEIKNLLEILVPLLGVIAKMENKYAT